MKAFISSTSLDLGDYRDGAREVCNRLAVVPIGMESFESMGQGATAGSRAKVKEANVYVGIIANRYGFVETGHDTGAVGHDCDARVRGALPLAAARSAVPRPAGRARPGRRPAPRARS